MPPISSDIKLTVSQFSALVGQILDYSFTNISIIGEVANYKISQGKWLFFDLKDESSVISCFMPIYSLHAPITEGMKIIARGTPRLTDKGKFSFTITGLMPVGEGNIKKSFDILKQKLEKEGLFDKNKKRPLPDNIHTIGVISSPTAAGYADFVKILNERWGGLKLIVASTAVQGLSAPGQIIRALNYFNEHANVDIIAIIRGGGSAEDLACFNDESLVRAISASKLPVITGIGHEIDTSLSDLSADIVASTPSNAAQMLSNDKKELSRHISAQLSSVKNTLESAIRQNSTSVSSKITSVGREIVVKITTTLSQNAQKAKILASMNPENVLKRGYAMLSGNISPGNVVKITTYDKIITSEVKNVQNREQ